MRGYITALGVLLILSSSAVAQRLLRKSVGWPSMGMARVIKSLIFDRTCTLLRNADS